MKRLAILCLVCAACGAGDAGWTGSIETLEGGRVRVTNPEQGVWNAESGWRLVPELTIGEMEGAEEYVFASISGLQVDGDGRIYVLDRQTNELRIFDETGAHVRTVGRAGEGPGEYQAANGLVWFSPDTLLVVDQRGARYSLLTREGDYVRSVQRRLGYYGWAFQGGRVGTRVFEISSVYRGDDDSYPAMFATDLGAAVPLESEVEVDTGAAGFTRAHNDTIPLPVHDAPRFESFSIRTERGGMVMGVPFAPSSVYYLDEQGEVWHGHGNEFRVFRSTLAGDTRMEILQQAVPTRVSPEERDAWEAGESVQRFRDMGGNLDMSRIPQTKPYFDGFVRDGDGYLWVSVPAAPYEMVFAVFDPDGRYLGRLQANGLSRTTWVPPVVRDGRLYVVGTDELDVPRIHVFRIEKS